MADTSVLAQEAVQAVAPVASEQDKEDPPENSAFECNICYDLAQSPVVTIWMQVQSDCRVCPVCKAGIEQDKVIPIYGRGGDNTDPRQKAQSLGNKEEDKDGPVPRRPAGQRIAPVLRGGMSQRSGNVNLQPGLGILPTLFGMQQAPGQGGFAEPLTAEQQHQAFLSRLLLMLGSFVIMCLLLF
ncbi:hypothetical protein WJX75_007419 [Coccomyxa subellipsoidea]|uniref:RING-type E3 ubiquitin transferase n=1 Tax=Coccomyxa subellipsoidea TaxID=248742 RepID=A0ABR2YJN8_9CHLO